MATHKVVYGMLPGVVLLLFVLTACASSRSRASSQSRPPVTTASRVVGASSLLGSAPRGVLASIVAAVRAQKSVHLSASFSADLVGTTTWTVDANALSGRKLLKYYGSRMRIILVNHTVYVWARARLLGPGLVPGLGLTEAQSKRYAGRWISIPAGDKLYPRLADGLTLASIAQDLTAEKGFHLTVFRTKSHLGRLVDVRGTPARYTVGRYDLKARATRTALPLAFFVDPVGANMVFYRGRFSRWNEPLRVTAPRQAIPIATVRRS